MFLLPFSNRSRLPEGDVTKNRTSSSETIKFTLATRAGYPFSNTQSHNQYNNNINSQTPRYPISNASPNPTLSFPGLANSQSKRNNNNNYNRNDANKFKLDPDHSQTFTLTTGFRYNNNKHNNNFDKTSNSNANRTHQTHQTHPEYDTTITYRQQYKNPTTSTVSNNDQSRDELEIERDQEQHKKYLDFIVSDIQPQSFQVPSKTRATSTKPLSSSEKELVNAFVNSQSSLFIQSTPKSHVITTLPNKNTESQPISAIHIPSSRLPQNDTYRFTLTSGFSNGKQSKRNRTVESDYESDHEQATDNYQHASHAESENIPLYVRKPQSTNSFGSSANSIGSSINSISSSPKSISPLKHEIIIPTTYSPLRNWKIQYLKKPVLPGSEVFNTVVDAVAPEDMKKVIFGSPNNRTKPDTTPSAVPTIQRDVVAPSSKTVSKFSFTFDGDKDYERPAKPFNRQPTKFPSLEFRERLNRTFDTTTAKPLISPYASLQTILEDIKPTQYRPSLGSYSITIGKNNIQSSSTTSTTTTTTTVRPSTSSSSSFFRSYFIITAPPKNNTQAPYQVSSTARPPVSYTPFSSSSSTTPISITSPVSITTNYPPVSSTQKPYDWTPISSSIFPNNPIQIRPNDERFRPMKPTDRPIEITEKPIISITTAFPQKVNHYDSYIPNIQHNQNIQNIQNNHNNQNIPNSSPHDYFPPYQTTTPISITTSTPQISSYPQQVIAHASTPSGFSPLPSYTTTPQGREHYRKVVRMRSKKKLNNSAGGLTPVILNPNVQELTEDDPALESMRNNNFMKALENVLVNEQKVEQSTKGFRGKPPKSTKGSRPTTKIPSSHFAANEEETLLRPSKGKNIQFMVDDDGKLVKYTVLSDDVTPTRFYSNYRHVNGDEEQGQGSSVRHNLGDYIRDGTKYSIVKDEEEEEDREHEQDTKPSPTLEDFVKDGSKYATEISEVTDDILSLATLADMNEPISSSTELHPEQREKFRATVEMPEFNVPTESEIKARLKQLESDAEKDVESEYKYETTTHVASRKFSIDLDLTNETQERNQIDYESPTTDFQRNLTFVPLTMFDPLTSTTIRTNDGMTSTQTRLTSSTTQKSYSSTNSVNTLPPRASRINPAIKSTIAGTPTRRMNAHTTPGLRIHQHTTPIIKCVDAKCNEIPSRYIMQTKNK